MKLTEKRLGALRVIARGSVLHVYGDNEIGITGADKTSTLWLGRNGFVHDGERVGSYPATFKVELTDFGRAAHQDVAGVVERLRKHVNDRGGFAKDDNGVPVGTAWPMMLEAATLIESLSKALSEAEAQADKYCEWWREKRNECMAAESRLAEAMKVIEQINVICYTPTSAGEKAGRHFQRDFDSIRKLTAALLNAGKE